MLPSDKFLIRIFSLTAIQKNPMSILRGDYALENRYAKGTVAYTLDFPGLIYILRKNIVMIGIIMITVCGISLFFVHESKARAEKKQVIERRLLIVIIALSVLTFFDLLWKLFEFLK